MAKDEAGVAVVEVPQTPPTDAEKAAAPFFPWEHGERPQLPPKKTSAFPVVGVLAVLGSALTVLMSFAVLKSMDGHKVFVKKAHGPAGWLSVILSANSILLHMAMQEGINISWWFQAQKDRATAACLHENWAMGTSLVSAVRAGRKFNYIALATIFISTIPLNGWLLQNALTSHASTEESDHGSVYVPILQQFPLGFSANVNNDGSMGLLNPDFTSAAIAWFNMGGYINPWAVELSPTLWNTFCNGTNPTCTAVVPGAGFWPSCSSYSIQRDLDPAANNYANFTARILDSSVTWNASLPNQINLDLLWKDTDEQCNTTLQVVNCTLQAATVRYPIVIANETFGTAGDSSIVVHLDPDSTWQNDTLVQTHLDSLPGEGNTNTTYGGVATILGNFFNGSMDITYTVPAINTNTTNSTSSTNTTSTNGRWSSSSTGFLPNTLAPILPADNLCTVAFEALNTNQATQQADLASNVIEGLRNLMLMASVYGVYDNAVTPGPRNVAAVKSSAHQSVPVDVYEVVWTYWCASIAVTLAIGLGICPTFYGYWRLSRRTTLSPFETARAFNAPVISEVDDRTDTPGLLKVVGGWDVHKDLGRGQAPAAEVQR